MTWKKVYNLLLLAFLFLLPWQTRYIWHYGELNTGYWEYGTFSIYATEILLWIILLLFLVQQFLCKEFWLKLKEKKSRVSLILILFLLTLGLATVLSSNFWVSYNFVFKFLEAMALMTILFWEQKKTKYQIALWAGGILQGMLAIWQFLTQHVWASKWLGMASQEAQNLGPSVIEFADQRWLRAYGSFGSPNSLGIYLAILFVLGLVLCLKAELWRDKILLSAGQLVILSGLLVSFSRGAWIAVMAGTVFLFIILFFKQRQSLYNFAKQIFFALILTVILVYVFSPIFMARFNLGNRLEIKSISERRGQYGEALSFIKSNTILGIGPGSYTYALYKKYPTLPAWQYQPIHNIYLLALVELGLAGIVFLFFLFKRFFWLMVKNNLIYTPVIAVLLVAGIFDHWLWSMYTGILLLWIVWGLAFQDP